MYYSVKLHCIINERWDKYIFIILNIVLDTNIRRPGQSLPDLRIPLDFDSGEDSTDSLIEESEEFLRKSIDSMVTGTDFQTARKRRSRRHSDPHFSRGKS